MSTKHTALDRKLFQWVREQRTQLTIANAISTLQIFGKAERRHISRRFMQMRARGLIRMTQTKPQEIFELCGVIPYDTSKPAWINAPQGSMRNKAIQEAPSGACSIQAGTSHEYEAKGGYIERLAPFSDVPIFGGRPTGHGFTFDE